MVEIKFINLIEYKNKKKVNVYFLTVLFVIREGVLPRIKILIFCIV